jgi:hypothetical protein
VANIPILEKCWDPKIPAEPQCGIAKYFFALLMMYLVAEAASRRFLPTRRLSGK